MPPGAKSGIAKLKPKQLSDKQLKLVEAVLDPKIKTLTEMAKISGYVNPANAYNALKSTKVRIVLADVQAALEQKGFNAEKIATMLTKGMSAEIVQRAQLNGEFTDEKKDIDYRERREHLKIGLELFKLTNGHLKNAVAEQHLHIHLSNAKDSELANDIRAQISAFN
jgi:hypothetical protein